MALFFAAAAILAQGCTTQVCSLVGWNEGLTVQLASEEALTEGSYHVVVEIPTETFELVFDIGELSSGGGAGADDRVERGAWQVNGSLWGSLEWGTNGQIVIGRLGPAGGGPEHATIVLEQGGIEIGRIELQDIDYETSLPNGPGCGVATTATEELSFSPLP